MLEFGRDVCNNLPLIQSREWLVTNGIGGFASGTVAGSLTRRYHGLLIAALHPPLGRTLMLAKIDEVVIYQKTIYPLFENVWENTPQTANGTVYLESFSLDGATPVWTYACGDALLEKRIWMQAEENTTLMEYTLRRATAPLTLAGKALVNHRDYHGITRISDWHTTVQPVPHGLEITPFDGAQPLFLLSADTQFSPHNEWYNRFYLSIEAYRGLDAVEDHLYAADFRAVLTAGQSVTIVASTEATPNLDGKTARRDRQAHEKSLAKQALAHLAPAPADRAIVRQLALAADQFVVCRKPPDVPGGHSVIAGYPWFSDWGRDTMIALPGLTLSTGRPEIAYDILTTYAKFLDRGMLPNRFPDEGEAPEYNTVDATLWYFQAVYHYFLYTDDHALVAQLYPVLKEIIEWHRRGTRFNIFIDPTDGLLHTGISGVQLTWMDAKVGDWVVTPRIGKPVEVNALWYNALRIMAELSSALNLAADAIEFSSAAAQVAKSFRQKFWFDDGGYLFDVVDTPNGSHNAQIRPNQIFAVSLPYPLLHSKQAKAVVDVCTRELLTPHGLRTLAQSDSAFVGHYGGGQRTRDGSYHQGTVWAWLLGPFVSAHLRVYGNPKRARTFLEPLFRQLNSHGIGSISEIFDGDAPFTPRGCTAQAWSVAELLRAWHEIKSFSQKK